MNSAVVRLALLFVLSGAGCDYETFSTRAGKHVVYRWNPDERMLCGGTVVYADRLAEAMASHYAMSLAEDRGPTVEYFWSIADAGVSACTDRGACVLPTPTTRGRWLSSVHSEEAIHPHELAHAVVGFRNHAFPVFINEGMAVRWQSNILGGEEATRTIPLVLDESQVRAEIDKLAILDSNDQYDAAFVWFAALEATFGPEKVGEFLRSLNALSSSDEVDEALQRTAGVSLAVSVKLAAGYLPLTFDDPVCEMKDVPTLVWDGAAIVVDRRFARCEQEDIVNWYSRVKSLFIIEFPDDFVRVKLTVTGATDSLSLSMDECLGDVRWGGNHQTTGGLANRPARELKMRGRWVASLIGDIDDDGNVVLPRVEFAPTVQ